MSDCVALAPVRLVAERLNHSPLRLMIAGLALLAFSTSSCWFKRGCDQEGQRVVEEVAEWPDLVMEQLRLTGPMFYDFSITLPEHFTYGTPLQHPMLDETGTRVLEKVMIAHGFRREHGRWIPPEAFPDHPEPRQFTSMRQT